MRFWYSLKLKRQNYELVRGVIWNGLKAFNQCIYYMLTTILWELGIGRSNFRERLSWTSPLSVLNVAMPLFKRRPSARRLDQSADRFTSWGVVTVSRRVQGVGSFVRWQVYIFYIWIETASARPSYLQTYFWFTVQPTQVTNWSNQYPRWSIPVEPGIV